MTDNNLVLDLCSGLGGASAAFDQEKVVKIDIEKKFKPDIVADVQHLPLRSGLQPKLAIYSPPCNCFSIASVYRHWHDGKPNPETEKAIELVKAGLEEIKRLNPEFWIMENPMGMLRTVMGKPRSTIRQSDYGAPWKKPTDLWGNVPFRMLPAMRSWPKAPRGDHQNSIQGRRWNKCGPTGFLVRNPAMRAKWPYGLSEAVRDACYHTNSSKDPEK